MKARSRVQAHAPVLVGVCCCLLTAQILANGSAGNILLTLTDLPELIDPGTDEATPAFGQKARLAEVTLQAGAVDLAIESVQYAPKKANATNTVAVVVKNVGTARSGTFWIECAPRIPTGGNRTAGFTYSPTNWVGGGLGAGQSRSFDYTIKPVIGGTFHQTVRVFTTNEDSSTTGNNYIESWYHPSRGSQNMVSIECPDLQVLSVVYSRSPLLADYPMTVTVVVAERRGAPTVPFAVDWHSDVPISPGYSQARKEWTVPALPQRESHSLAFTFIPVRTGTFNFTATVDSQQQVQEEDMCLCPNIFWGYDYYPEQNNQFTGTFKVEAPYLRLEILRESGRTFIVWRSSSVLQLHWTSSLKPPISWSPVTDSILWRDSTNRALEITSSRDWNRFFVLR